MNYWDILKVCGRWFRRRRLRRFSALFPPSECRSIIDIGGGPDIWEIIDYPARITIVNINKNEFADCRDNVRRTYQGVIGDGRKLGYPDNCFDLAFANSVIEHVGNEEDATAFAREIQRVGRGFYCQTPNKWFPIEPHLGSCFLHWIPCLLSNYFVVRYCTLWGLLNKPNQDRARQVVESIRLLTKAELRRLFPDATIKSERFLFCFVKSYTVLRTAGRRDSSERTEPMKYGIVPPFRDGHAAKRIPAGITDSIGGV